MRVSLTIGTRGSQLALWQAELVRSRMIETYGCEVVLKKIKTTGDKILDSPLAKIGDTGLFVKEIEVALAKGEVDLAVHSMKDLPTELLPELTIGAYLKRDNPADALISREGLLLVDLPEGAVIGTSSLRRKAQLMAYRPDFRFVDMRGNVDTRLRKLEEQKLDAILLSGAGLTRLGWEDKITERLPAEVVVPAVGQGVIAVEIRRDDEEMIELADQLNDVETEYCVVAERSFSLAIEGGCQIPMGALAILDGGVLSLRAVVASLDGKRVVKDRIEGDPSEGDELGRKLASRMLAAGADKILEEIRCETTGE
jgi:hydroxymethylbilane synthase